MRSSSTTRFPITHYPSFGPPHGSGGPSFPGTRSRGRRSTRADEVYRKQEVDLAHPPRRVVYGDLLKPWSRSRWDYLSYDCQRGEGSAPGIVDIIAPVLLNVTRGYGVELVSDLLEVAPGVQEVVSGVPNDFCFWDLDRRRSPRIASQSKGHPQSRST